MKRFLAVVGVAAFLAACSDSNMTNPVSQLRPGIASRDAGDPPPPPVSGSGQGGLDLFGSDLSTQAVSTTSQTSCASGHSFNLVYDLSYVGNNPNNNQVVHATLTGDVTGTFDVHQNENGKSNAHGHIADTQFSFDIQSGSQNLGGGISAVIIDGTAFVSFDFSVTGILTNLATGEKCQASGDLFGSSSSD